MQAENNLIINSDSNSSLPDLIYDTDISVDVSGVHSDHSDTDSVSYGSRPELIYDSDSDLPVIFGQVVNTDDIYHQAIVKS